jgi:hypothetical protein
MPKDDLSSRHSQRKISEFCEARISPISSKRVLENVRPYLISLIIPQAATDPERPSRLARIVEELDDPDLLSGVVNAPPRLAMEMAGTSFASRPRRWQQ